MPHVKGCTGIGECSCGYGTNLQDAMRMSFDHTFRNGLNKDYEKPLGERMSLDMRLGYCTKHGSTTECLRCTIDYLRVELDQLAERSAVWQLERNSARKQTAEEICDILIDQIGTTTPFSDSIQVIREKFGLEI